MSTKQIDIFKSKVESWLESDRTETLQDYLDLDDVAFLNLICDLKKRVMSGTYDEHNINPEYTNIVSTVKKSQFRKVINL